MSEEISSNVIRRFSEVTSAPAPDADPRAFTLDEVERIRDASSFHGDNVLSKIVEFNSGSAEDGTPYHEAVFLDKKNRATGVLRKTLGAQGNPYFRLQAFQPTPSGRYQRAQRIEGANLEKVTEAFVAFMVNEDGWRELEQQAAAYRQVHEEKVARPGSKPQPRARLAPVFEIERYPHLKRGYRVTTPADHTAEVSKLSRKFFTEAEKRELKKIEKQGLRAGQITGVQYEPLNNPYPDSAIFFKNMAEGQDVALALIKKSIHEGEEQFEMTVYLWNEKERSNEEKRYFSSDINKITEVLSQHLRNGFSVKIKPGDYADVFPD